MEQEKLVIKYNDDTHKWELALEDALTKVQAFIKSLEHSELVIQNDLDYKLIYKNRTDINNKVKEIASIRKQAIKSITGDFEKACKTLESELINAANRMTTRLNEYKPKVKGDDIYVMTFSTNDKKAYEKVKAYILKYNITDIKEEIK